MLLLLLAALLFSRAAGLKCHKYAGQDDLMNSEVDDCVNASSKGCYRVAGWKGESKVYFGCNDKSNVHWKHHWYEGGCDCENARYGIYVGVAQNGKPKDVCYEDRHRTDDWDGGCSKGASHIKGTACCCYGDHCNGADLPNRRRQLLVLLAPAVLLLLRR